MTDENTSPAEARDDDDSMDDADFNAALDLIEGRSEETDEPDDTSENELPAEARSDSEDEAPDAEQDIWANAPEALREAYEETQTRLKRESKRTQELNQKLRQAREYIPPAEAREEDQAEERANLLEELENEFPEVAEAMSPLKGTLEQQSQQIERLLAAEQARERATEQSQLDVEQEQTEILLAEHPDAVEVFQNNRDEYMEWANSPDLSLKMHRAAMAAVDSIDDGKEVAGVISAFKSYLSSHNQSADTGNSDQPKRRNPKREKQLKGARQPAPRSTMSQNVDDADDEAYFNEVADSIARQHGIR